MRLGPLKSGSKKTANTKESIKVFIIRMKSGTPIKGIISVGCLICTGQFGTMRIWGNAYSKKRSKSDSEGHS